MMTAGTRTTVKALLVSGPAVVKWSETAGGGFLPPESCSWLWLPTSLRIRVPLAFFRQWGL